MNNSLITAVRKIFGFGVKEESGSGYQRPVTPEMAKYDAISLKNDRRSKMQDCQKMRSIDPRARRILNKLASDATVGGFTIRVEQAGNENEKKKVQTIIDKLTVECKIKEKMKGWIRSYLRDGDLFWEIVVNDSTKEIVRIKKLAAVMTYSNMNSEGNFPEGEPAYYQEHPWSGEKIKTFEQWQIVQIQWEADDGDPYGDPILSSARLSWDRLDSGEKNIVIRRAIRAGRRLHHKIGSVEKPATWQEVEKYKERNKDTLSRPMDPAQDFFSNGTVTIEEIGGDASLGELEDLRHFEGLIAMSAGVPEALLGGGREKGINRDVLEEQEEDYYRVVTDIADSVEWALRIVFRCALLLQDINDESVVFTFNWGARDREDIETKIDRAIKLQGLGFSYRTIFELCDLDGITFEEEMNRIRTQVSEGIIPYGIGMKLDPTMMMLLSGTQTPKQNPKVTEQIIQSLGNLKTLLENQISPEGSMKNPLRRIKYE